MAKRSYIILDVKYFRDICLCAKFLALSMRMESTKRDTRVRFMITRFWRWIRKAVILFTVGGIRRSTCHMEFTSTVLETYGWPILLSTRYSRYAEKPAIYFKRNLSYYSDKNKMKWALLDRMLIWRKETLHTAVSILNAVLITRINHSTHLPEFLEWFSVKDSSLEMI